SLARSRASLLQVSLEDLWSEERPQNVPGTGLEQSNFLRKAGMSLEEMTADQGIDAVLREVDRLRDPSAAVEGGAGVEGERGAHTAAPRKPNAGGRAHRP